MPPQRIKKKKKKPQEQLLTFITTNQCLSSHWKSNANLGGLLFVPNVISGDYRRTEFAHCSNNETIIRVNTTLLCTVDFSLFPVMSFSLFYTNKLTVFHITVSSYSRTHTCFSLTTWCSHIQPIYKTQDWFLNKDMIYKMLPPPATIF